MLGDAAAQMRDALAHGTVGGMVADAAAVPHRERVLPGVHQLLELGPQRLQLSCFGHLPPTFHGVDGMRQAPARARYGHMARTSPRTRCGAAGGSRAGAPARVARSRAAARPPSPTRYR